MIKYVATVFLWLTAALIASSANASTITLTDLGTVTQNGNIPLLTNVSIANSLDAPIVTGKTANASSTSQWNTTVGWNPYGVSNTTNQWIDIGGSFGTPKNYASTSSITFNLAAPENSLSFVWGSPSVTNTISLYSGANGSGSLIGTVSYTDLAALNFSNTGNTTGAGALIDLSSQIAFRSVIFSTGSGYGGFEIAQISAAPIPGSLVMFGATLVALGGFAHIRSRRTKSSAAAAV